MVAQQPAQDPLRPDLGLGAAECRSQNKKTHPISVPLVLARTPPCETVPASLTKRKARISVGGKHADAEDTEVLTVNVGGELVTLARGTMLLAPVGSALRDLFQNEWSTTQLARDDQGRMFLNYPPRTFQIIVDHLRMLHGTPPNRAVPPPCVPRDAREEFEDLADILGVYDFIVGRSHWGRGKLAPKDSVPPATRSRACCARRRVRPLSPPPDSVQGERLWV